MKKILFLAIAVAACRSNPEDMHEFTNSLINSTSPYLQQHAHNPVDWVEWGPEALERAKKEDKPILVSIGYSSCHWCHVMEKESFEDTAVANIMNAHFINIKVDREERPDVDQVYMDAVQAMGLQGGWPLNVFLTPDQKPFYGGTYFPRKGWVNLLLSINDAFKENRDKIDESAEAFTQNLQLKESEKYKLEGTDYTFNKEEQDSTFQALERKFDYENGGINKAPKFPMPSVWNYLASYYYRSQNENAFQHLIFTLEKIADGGIYDHIGGGFARYSTDASWHIPHFEKMLYDNGQLLSLYATGYKLSQNPKFKNVMIETTDWLRREMLDKSGGFYSALDADSEGEEGKFYVWDYDELKLIAGSNFEWISEYFDIQPDGNWEGNNVLRVVVPEDQIIEKHQLDDEEFRNGIQSFKKAALTIRDKRIRPGLDNKIIAGWNGLVLSGLCHSFQATGDSVFINLAKDNASFIKQSLIRNGRLNRFPDKDLEGFMEDYSSVIQSFIVFYETTFQREYLDLAVQLAQRVESAFFDESENLYFFTSDESQNLIARKKEFFDNVIPSSNSMMAWNLVHLGTHLYNDEMIAKGKSVLAQVKNLIKTEPEYLSNWATLAMELSGPFAEVIIVGSDVIDYATSINKHYLPNKIISGTAAPSEQPPFEYKSMLDDQTTIYVCFNKTCKLPVTTPENAMVQLGISPQP